MPHPRKAVRSWRTSAPLFAALGDERRLRVLARLRDEGPLSIARLTEGEAVTRQAMTKHLHVLEGAGLVRGTERGRESVWWLEPSRLVEARHLLELLDACSSRRSPRRRSKKSAPRGGQNMRAHRNM